MSRSEPSTQPLIVRILGIAALAAVGALTGSIVAAARRGIA
jgi:hypothetical protein